MPDGALLGRPADVAGDGEPLDDPDVELDAVGVRRVVDGVLPGVRVGVGVETVTDPAPAPIVGPSAAGLPPEQADTPTMAAAASSASRLPGAAHGNTE